MGARTKLNGAYFLGAGLVASLFGSLCQSWLVFLIVFLVLAGISMYDGSIRPKPYRQ